MPHFDLGKATFTDVRNASDALMGSFGGNVCSTTWIRPLVGLNKIMFAYDLKKLPYNHLMAGV